MCIHAQLWKAWFFFLWYLSGFETKAKSINFDSISSEPDSVTLDAGGMVPFLASGAIDFNGISCQIRSSSDQRGYQKSPSIIENKTKKTPNLMTTRHFIYAEIQNEGFLKNINALV